MFRAVCAAVKPIHSQEYLVDFTSSFAAQHQLEIDAWSVIDPERIAPAESSLLGGGVFKIPRDDQAVAAARQTGAELMTRMETESAARGVKCRAQVCEGDTLTVLADAVESCDLLVCGHAGDNEATDRSLLPSLLKHCSRPVILVPRIAYSADQAVLVAYDGSPQAARTLASFADSGLATGRSIHVASIDNGSGQAENSAETAERFLQRHGIVSDVHPTVRAQDVGNLIFGEAKRVAAGLIVMGALGRSAVSELFSSPAFQAILEGLNLPMFLDI